MIYVYMLYTVMHMMHVQDCVIKYCTSSVFIFYFAWFLCGVEWWRVIL